MDNLRKYIRELILETKLLTEGKTVSDVQLGRHKFYVDKNNAGFTVHLYIDDPDRSGDPAVRLTALYNWKLKWGEDGIMSVGAIYADGPGGDGWGPFVCDIAMEYATNIMDNWLCIDRVTVSPEAQRMWQYYLDNRIGQDVQGLQLDDFNNTMTPDAFDNVDTRQFDDIFILKHAKIWNNKDSDPETYKKVRTKMMQENALMWAFKKEPTTIDWLLKNAERKQSFIEFTKWGKNYKPKYSTPFASLNPFIRTRR